MEANNFSASVTYVLGLADVDFMIAEAIEGKSDKHNQEQLKYILISDYFTNNHISIDMYSIELYKDILRRFLECISCNSTVTVEFTQTYQSYIFKVAIPQKVVYLPLVITRALMSFLKTLGIKCEAYKRNKSLCSDIDIFFTELCFTGKSDIDISVFKPIADACKKIKGKITPWYKEYELPTEEQQSLLSEASARFRGAEWFEKAQKDVTLIGAGGLGRF